MDGAPSIEPVPAQAKANAQAGAAAINGSRPAIVATGVKRRLGEGNTFGVMPVRPCLLSSAFASIASAISTCTDELVRIWWLGIKSVRTQGWDGYTVSTGEKKALC